VDILEIQKLKNGFKKIKTQSLGTQILLDSLGIPPSMLYREP